MLDLDQLFLHSPTRDLGAEPVLLVGHVKPPGDGSPPLHPEATAGVTEPRLLNSVAKLTTQFSCGLHVATRAVEKV